MAAQNVQHAKTKWRRRRIASIEIWGQCGKWSIGMSNVLLKVFGLQLDREMNKS